MRFVCNLIIMLFVVVKPSQSSTHPKSDTKEKNTKTSAQPSTEERVKARLEQLGIPPEGDLSSLPIHSKETQKSECPDVSSDVITYRLDFADGIDPDAVLLHQTVWNIVPEIIFYSVGFHSLYHKNETFTLGGPRILGNMTVWPHLNCLDWDSEQLLAAVKQQLKPSSNLPYNFSIPQTDLPLSSLEGEHGQPRVVDELVYGGKLKNGFFIEAGSYDSEQHSDSLYWELKHGWTGLLVEPDPIAFDVGLTRHRQATSLQSCLSTTTRAANLKFRLSGTVKDHGEGLKAMAGLVPESTAEEGDESIKMQCLPLYTILLALGNPAVHFFSLDIEGAELPVLKTVPWDKVDIRVLTVETHFAGQVYPGDRREVIAYMEEVGYRHIPDAMVGVVVDENEGVPKKQDDLFVRNDVPLLKEDLGTADLGKKLEL